MGRASQIEGIISKGQLVVHSFGQNAIAASQTDADLLRVETSGGTTDVDAYEAPFDFTIVAISATTSAAATAGTLDIVPVVGGTAATEPALAFTTETALTATAERDAIAGVAGDAIGVQITTNGSWDGTTADLEVDVYVLYHLEGI